MNNIDIRAYIISNFKEDNIEEIRNSIEESIASHDEDPLIGLGVLFELFWNNSTDEEKEKAKKDMEEMLDYIDKLNELDTSSVEPMSHVFPVNNVFREDVVTNGDGTKQTLANAPEQKDDSFVVPKTIVG